jgi:hypothetical protein
MMALAVLPLVLRAHAQGQLEVELDRRELPGTRTTISSSTRFHD